MKRSSTVFNIPSGKRVKISYGALNDDSAGDPILLMLTDTLAIPTTASFSGISNSTSFTRSLLGEGIGWLADQIPESENSFLQSVKKGIDTFGGVVSGMNVSLGYQIFTGTSPLQVTLSCAVQARTNAFEEVVDPIRRLQLLVAPKVGEGGFVTDFPGPDAMVALTGRAAVKDCSIRVGRFGFNHVLIKSVDPTFSTEVDQTGWPISANVQISFETTYQLSQNMINEELYRVSTEGSTINSDQSEVNKPLKWQDQGWS